MKQQKTTQSMKLFLRATVIRALFLSVGLILLLLIAVRVAQAISVERRGGVAERVFWQYDDPNVTLNSYAAVTRYRSNGGFACSGTMIGPNIMITAGHCPQALTLKFRLYTAEDRLVTETFTSEQITHSFLDTDIVLHYVWPNAAGENPGDKYGYLDFDLLYRPDGRVDVAASRTKLAVAQDIYSIWSNPINELGPGEHMLYSEGEITANDGEFWFTPNLPDGTPTYRCTNDGPPARAIGVSSDLWSKGGASGSSSISADTHRLLLGPQSLGVDDARGRDQLSIFDYIFYGYADPNLLDPDCHPDFLPAVSEDLLASLGLPDPDRFYGFMDKELDGVFDVQHELERLYGEASRDFYWLGFESVRRNLLWREAADVVRFDPTHATVEVDTVDISGHEVDVLTHDKLNLQPGKRYVMSFYAFVLFDGYTGSGNPMRVELLSSEGAPLQSISLDPASSLRHVITFEPERDPGALNLVVAKNMRILLLNVVVAEEGAVLDFDTHDKRATWLNVDQQALIWPNGIQSDSVPDWAGVVKRHSERPGNNDWSLSNFDLAVDADQRVKVCFMHKLSPHNPLTGHNTMGAVRFRDSSGNLASLLFVPGDTWQNACTEAFDVINDHNVLDFGVWTTNLDAEGAYLVDNVTVRKNIWRIYLPIAVY